MYRKWLYIVTYVPCFSETFLKTSHYDFVHLDSLVNSYCRKDKRRGGTCVFVKNNIYFCKLDCFDHIALEKYFECCGIKKRRLNLTLIAVLRPPSKELLKNS